LRASAGSPESQISGFLGCFEPAGEILSVTKELGGAIGVPGEAWLAGVKDVRVYVFVLPAFGDAR
jgi:hypothetical protein